MIQLDELSTFPHAPADYPQASGQIVCTQDSDGAITWDWKGGPRLLVTGAFVDSSRGIATIEGNRMTIGPFKALISDYRKDLDLYIIDRFLEGEHA